MDDPEPTLSAAELRAIVRWQGCVAPLLGLQLGLWVLYAVGIASGHVRDSGEAAAYLIVIGTAIGLVAGAAVALLVTKLKETASVAVLGLLAAVPLVGVAAMAVAYRRANGALRRHGVRVGLLGASRADLDKLEDESGDSRPDEDEGW